MISAERTFLVFSFFLPPLLFLLRSFSGAPSRDTPLDSASLKRIITVIKRIKVIPSCTSRSPVSRKVKGMRIAWRSSHPHFRLPFYLPQSFAYLAFLSPSFLYLRQLLHFQRLVILSAFNFRIIFFVKLFTVKSEVMRNISICRVHQQQQFYCYAPRCTL